MENMILNTATTVYKHIDDLFATILYIYPFLKFSQHIDTERPNITRISIIDASNVLQGEYKKHWYFG